MTMSQVSQGGQASQSEQCQSGFQSSNSARSWVLILRDPPNPYTTKF